MTKRLLSALLIVLLAAPALAQEEVEGIEINAMPAVTTPADTDMLATDQVGDTVTRKITRAQIVSGVLALLQAHEALTGAHGITAYMETLLDDVDAATARATLELGTAAQSATGDFEAAGAVSTHSSDTTSVHGIADTSALLDSSDIGSTVQAQDAELAALAGLTSAADKLPYFTGSGAAATTDLTSAARNVLDDTTTGAMLTTLGAASTDHDATHQSGGTDALSGTLDVTISGNAATATALAANGTNCSAGNYPLGVDASGNAESCTAAGGIGGSTGATDDAILRANGTGGSTAQGSLATVDDSGRLRLPQGSASQVAIGFSADNDVGIYQRASGSNTLTFSAGVAVGEFDGARFNLASNQGFGWASSGIGSAVAVGFVSTGDSVRAGSGSTLSNPGSLLSSVLVEASTAGSGAPNVLTSVESGTCINNNGATALVYQTLPAAAAGLHYCGCVTDADGIRFTAVGDDTIRDGGSVTGAAGTMESTQVGDCVDLVGMDSASWYVKNAYPSTHGWTLSAP